MVKIQYTLRKKVAVETVTDAIIMTDNGIVIEEEEFTKDVMCARGKLIVSLNYEHGT